ncbi:MAG: hypothetical protein JXB62_22855 [Pirellulales bacterium]|nr:hypothetical protein [Pirellulales bacterium]
MGNMDGWDVALLMVAAYVATMTLVRLMVRRRNQLLAKFREEVKIEKKRRQRETKRQRAA